MDSEQQRRVIHARNEREKQLLLMKPKASEHLAVMKRALERIEETSEFIGEVRAKATQYSLRSSAAELLEAMWYHALRSQSDYTEDGLPSFLAERERNGL